MTDERKDVREASKSQGPLPRRRLLRSPRERLLAGVAGGLGEYLGVDPTLVRLGFVAAAFFGGFGVLAYLVMAVVVPEDDGSGEPVSDRRPPLWALIMLGIALLFALPGPLWGWGWGDHGWWWGFAGPLWIAILIAAGIWAYRALRGRPLRLSRGEGRARPKQPAAEKADAEAAADADRLPQAVRALAIVVLVMAGIAAAGSLAALSAWATATGNGAVVAGVVVALGVALAATALIGDGGRAHDGANRSARGGPWLLGLALVLALPAGAVAAADLRFQGGIGERKYEPASTAQIPADGYELGIGRLAVDLRRLPWRAGELVSVESDLGVGQMVLAVPSHVCVIGEADAKAGELLVQGDSNSGVDPEFRRGGATRSEAPRLELDAEIQLGQLVVTDEDPDEVRDRGGDDAEEAAAAGEACER